MITLLLVLWLAGAMLAALLFSVLARWAALDGGTTASAGLARVPEQRAAAPSETPSRSHL